MSVAPALVPAAVRICSKPSRIVFSAVPVDIPAEETIDGRYLARPDWRVGELAEFDVDVRIDSDIGMPGGVQGWSMSLAHDQALEIIEIKLDDIEVPTLTRDAGGSLVSDPMNLADAGFQMAATAAGAGGEAGVVSAVVLDFRKDRVLPGISQVAVLRIRYRTREPVVAGPNGIYRIEFLDGLQGPGNPVINVATLDGLSHRPSATRNLTLVPKGLRSVPFIRGDANRDLKVNIADIISIVYAVIPSLDGESVLCVGSGDANSSGGMDLGDATYLIAWLFLAGPEPSLPFPGCGFDPADPGLCLEGTVPVCNP
jgi:hypothetical protein